MDPRKTLYKILKCYYTNQKKYKKFDDYLNDLKKIKLK